MSAKSVLLCTVGTSLFRPNLETLRNKLQDGSLQETLHPVVEAYFRQDWAAVAQALLRLSPQERICGAEINSIASMIDQGYVLEDCSLYFLHSDTPDGRHIGEVLTHYYRFAGHPLAQALCVPDLQDDDPRKFRTRGLRNLARLICQVIRQHSPQACAINATGGYKAQIAIAVILGQAIGVPVYYMHERFSEIISFPPMPIALDFELWMRVSGMLYDLEASSEPVLAKFYAEDWDERYESLVERICIDGEQYLDLSATGQIFHETYKERFRTHQDQVLPPPALQKRPPRLEKTSWVGHHPEVRQFLQKITDEIPAVVQCCTFYYNPDLPERMHFRISQGDVVGIYSNRKYTVKFRVESTAQTEGQKAALVAFLNDWLFRQN
ncbi:MAG: putative CRISPR-associated protein [Gemmatales bacterium]|nr:putative CRISPR-associated protein [Gemmatales bacterium]MDW8176526.1 putative CRISPR-associated protein [Gemmatales bacterium]